MMFPQYVYDIPMTFEDTEDGTPRYQTNADDLSSSFEIVLEQPVDKSTNGVH